MARKKLDPESEAALEIVEAEKKEAALAKEQEARRAEVTLWVGRMMGRAETADMFAKYGDLSRLVWLKQVKESKAYKEVPGVGTWEKFCKLAGLDRATVDEDLKNLEALGEELLRRVSSLGLGYRELRKLRRLNHDGDVEISENEIVIGGEAIPFDVEHKEDLQAALEKVVEEARADHKAAERYLKDKEKHIRKLEKILAKYEGRAAERDLSPEEDAFITQMENLRIGFDGYMLKLEPERMEALGEDATAHMRAEYLTTVWRMRALLKAAYDTAVDMYGYDLQEGEEDWSPPKR